MAEAPSGVDVGSNLEPNLLAAVMVCSRLKGCEIDIRRIPGTALCNAATGELIYTPPEGEAVLRQRLSTSAAEILLLLDTLQAAGR